ncbi:MAG: Riboflavin transporter RibZ [Paracidovorax wautersii]|uniref:Riboflavin transporter RibZ n=1 Tax=Paracidovorax wautersii TaxID=1177982 RepID=A0A7V8FR27_9BURK|nr:MAG: Riboflavin transporter RibZ [Paracidovorax wautersii]
MSPSTTPLAAATPPVDDGLPMPRRVWAILAVVLGIMLSVLDGTLANVALPTIAADLHASPSAAIWIVNAYQLAIIATLLPFAALGERVGYRRIFSGGVLVFTLASLACALAGSIEALVAARVVQGLAASAIMCCSSALLRYSYPAADLGKGIARNAFVVTVSSAAGPSICAAVLSVADWPWLFVLNVPIGIAALVACRTLPATPRQPRGFDLWSLLLNGLGMCLGVVGLGMLMHRPWVAVPLIALAALALWLLVRRSRGQATPLLPLDLFAIQRFRWAISASFCMFAAQMCAFVALPFYLQHTLGRSVVQTGLLMTAWPIGSSLTNLAISPFVDRVQAAGMCVISAALLIAGLALAALLPVGSHDGWMVFGLLLAGIGFGCFQAPNNREMLSAQPRTRSGAAGGMQATARVSGQAWGAVLAGLCFALSASHGGSIALGAAMAFGATAMAINLVRRQVLAPATSS